MLGDLLLDFLWNFRDQGVFGRVTDQAALGSGDGEKNPEGYVDLRS